MCFHSSGVAVSFDSSSSNPQEVCRFPGTPCYADSEGAVRMLNRSLGNTWTPVCNTGETCKSRSDHYWVVGVHENPQQLR